MPRSEGDSAASSTAHEKGLDRGRGQALLCLPALPHLAGPPRPAEPQCAALLLRCSSGSRCARRSSSTWAARSARPPAGWPRLVGLVVSPGTAHLCPARCRSSCWDRQCRRWALLGGAAWPGPHGSGAPTLSIGSGRRAWSSAGLAWQAELRAPLAPGVRWVEGVSSWYSLARSEHTRVKGRA
jgi:hypothetical protein